MIEKQEGRHLGELKTIAGDRMPILKLHDAKKALGCFDSRNGAIRDAAHGILRAIMDEGDRSTSRTEKRGKIPETPEETKAYWAQRIDTLQQQLE